MEKQFDIAIIGNNLPSAISAYAATKSLLKVAHIQEYKDREREKINSLIVFRWNTLTIPIKGLRQNKIIKLLKKIAAHLLVFTEIEEYKRLSVFSLFLIRFNNLFSNKQIKFAKIPGKEKFYKLNYQSYKISGCRLNKVLLKSSEKSKYKLFINEKIDIMPKGENYRINIGGRNITVKSTLTFSPENYKNQQNYDTILFSSLNDTLKLEKTLIWEEKSLCIKVIPWFDYVCFLIYSSDIKIKSTEKAIELINSYFPTINLAASKVLKFEIINETQSNGIIQTLKIDSNTFKTKSVTIAEHFLNAEKLINKVQRRQKKTDNEILVGSDFKMIYHPLRIMEFCDEKYDEAKQILQSPQYFKKLFYRYGTEIDKITYQAYEYWNKMKDIEKTWLKAEIWYAINYESCTSTEEFINNHTEEWMNGKSSNSELIETIFKELTVENNSCN